MYKAIVEEYKTYSDPKDKMWYYEVHEWAKSLGDIEKVAGVLAALSPNLSWPRNQELAEQAFAEGRASGALPLSCFRADQILIGEHPLNVLGGNKTRAFFQNIYDPRNRKDVTIDRHSLAVVLGRKVNDKEQKKLSGKNYYAMMSDAYITAAHTLKMIPSELQAATWCSWRVRYKGVKV